MKMPLCVKTHNPKSIINKSLPRSASKLNRKKISNNTYSINNESKDYKEVSPYTCLKGSYTLEAAIVLPLFTVFMVTILMFFRIMQVETQVQEALIYAGRMTAVECSTIDKKAVNIVTAEGLFRKEAKKYSGIGKYVQGGAIGITLSKSKVDGNYIELSAQYKVKFPVALIKVDGIKIVQRSINRKWTGKSIKGDDLDPYVYYTDTGTVYHLSSSCKYLDLSINAIKYGEIKGIRNKSGHKYYACSCAAAKITSNSTVYVTDYGTKYHSKLNCSSLKRTVHMERLSKVKNLKLCSKCAASEG